MHNLFHVLLAPEDLQKINTVKCIGHIEKKNYRGKLS